MFVRGGAVFGDQKNKYAQLGYNFANTGVVIGMDYRFTGTLIAGMMVGIDSGRSQPDTAGSLVKMDGITVGAYGTYYKSGFFLDGQLGYGMSTYDNVRKIIFPGLDRTASSDPRGELFSAYGGTGYDFRQGNCVITPVISLNYRRLAIAGYTETGAGSLNLSVERQAVKTLQLIVGEKVSYQWETAIVTVTPSIHAAIVHEFNNDDRVVTARLMQIGIPFSIQTAAVTADFALLGVGLVSDFKNGKSLYLNYDAQIGQDNYIAHGIYAGLRIRF